MAEQESRQRVCPVCRRKLWRSEFAEGLADWAAVVCLDCFRHFVSDCLDAWMSKQSWDNQVIGGYRRAELAYHDEYDHGGPSRCERCGDNHGWTGGCRDYIVLPDDKAVTLCHGCSEDWLEAADVEASEEWGDVFMSPAAVAAFQWSGVESQSDRLQRRISAEYAVSKRQGDKCADCGKTYRPGDGFVPWPWDMPDGFVMVCRPCGKRKEMAQAGVEA